MNENMNVNGLKHHDNHRRIIYRNRGSLEKSRLLAFGRSEMDRAALQVCGPLDLQGERMSIPEKILQAGCDAYAAKFLNGNGSLGDGIEAAYLAIHGHDDWVRAGPPAWTGEGLPPVGTVCEAMLPSMNHQWAEAVVVWHHPEHEGSAVVVHGGGRLTGWSSAFRPIRTPEQIAAEERKQAISEMVYGACECDPGDGTTTAFILCGLIYDAGYRKQRSL